MTIIDFLKAVDLREICEQNLETLVVSHKMSQAVGPAMKE